MKHLRSWNIVIKMKWNPSRRSLNIYKDMQFCLYSYMFISVKPMTESGEWFTVKEQLWTIIIRSSFNYLIVQQPLPAQNQKRWEISLKLAITTPEYSHWRRFGVFIVSFEHISQLSLVFLLLSMHFFAGVPTINTLQSINIKKINFKAIY